jgi:glucokinase
MQEHPIFAGIDLGGTSIKYGLCHSDGSVIAQFSAVAEVSAGPEALIERIAHCGRDLVAESERLGLRLPYVGFGTPGVVDPIAGKVVGMSPNIPGWEKIEIKQRLEASLGMPIIVENDVNAMAVAEHRCGAAKGFRNALTTTVGTGIGGGLIIDGRLYRGGIGAAGEIGHITVVKDGELCGCGRRGCLERYASAGSLLRSATEIARSYGGDSELTAELKREGRLTVQTILSAFRDGDEVAVSAVSTIVDYFACGLASVLAVMNPEVLVIGGGIAEGGGEKYVNLVAKRIREYAIEPSVIRLTVRPAQLGNSAGFIGAALLGTE